MNSKPGMGLSRWVYRCEICVLALCSISAFATSGQTIPIPKGHALIDSAMGDLDGLPGDELAVVYNMHADTSDTGVPRTVVVYRLSFGQWQNWKQSDQALYGSRDGGMMGDPYSGIQIIDRKLTLAQEGGSAWKWSKSESYRFENDDFYLIEYSDYFSKSCESSIEVDFNLSSGLISVIKEFEDCNEENQTVVKRESEEFLEKNLKISFAKRQQKKIILISPKYGFELFISDGKDE